MRALVCTYNSIWSSPVFFFFSFCVNIPGVINIEFILQSDHYVPDRMLKEIDNVTVSMMESGLIHLYRSLATFKQKLVDRAFTIANVDNFRALTMEQLNRPLVLLFCLWGAAMIVFVIETIIFKWKVYNRGRPHRQWGRRTHHTLRKFYSNFLHYTDLVPQTGSINNFSRPFPKRLQCIHWLMWMCINHAFSDNKMSILNCELPDSLFGKKNKNPISIEYLHGWIELTWILRCKHIQHKIHPPAKSTLLPLHSGKLISLYNSI